MSDFLVDTNVLVYAYDPSDDSKRQRGIAVLERLGDSGRGVLTTQVLGEFFVTVTRKIPSPLSPEQAERSLTNYVRSWTVFDLTPAVVLEAARAVRQYQMAYWDALVWSSAKLNQVAYVLTEDLTDGTLIENVRFVNPLSDSFDLAMLDTRA
ncbi:MAG: PIN domain nuclease [Dehalococcoidia bacterium]